VFTSSIYQAVHAIRAKIGLASAYAMTLLAMTTAGVYFVSRLSSRGSKYATMTGRVQAAENRPRGLALVRRRDFHSLLSADRRAALCRAALVLVPEILFGALVAGAEQSHSGPYRFIFTYPNLGRSVWNTLILSFGSATVIMLVTSVICWIVVKTKLPGRWVLTTSPRCRWYFRASCSAFRS